MSRLDGSCPSQSPYMNVRAIHVDEGCFGLLRELNPGPLAPEARIIPLDQAAKWYSEASIMQQIAGHHFALPLGFYILIFSGRGNSRREMW